MPDLVERLRRWTHAVDAAPASDLMDEAAAEIERLRLAEKERGAIKGAIWFMESGGAWAWPETLRGLLERTQ